PMRVRVSFVLSPPPGAVMYGLEPTIHNYWDGLWLAFVPGTTIGYGDLVPPTGASRLFAAFTALLGVSLVALFTANIVAFFVGGEEAQLRRDLQREVQELQQRIARLIDTEEVKLREDLHRDLNQLRQPLAQHLQLRMQFQHEITQLRRDLAALRDELAAFRDK